ncbi:MAG TPA: orotate phosphoribosyltransferase [Chitinophagaceae bacterium]|nr:orotate phosphoribosyltransferase [Chitinophagaceae bacterium]
MKNRARQIAEKLLQINAIQLNIQNPFTWSSGWKSPVYCDNRRILSFPFTRDVIKSEMSNLIFETFPEAEVLAGVATGGIAHGALVADQIKLPFSYIRSKAKGHGLGNRIEGVIKKEDKVVVVEDLVSTGGSSLEACKAVQEIGAEVVGLVSVFTYGFSVAEEAFEKAGIPFYSLSNYPEMIEEAKDRGLVSEEQMVSLSEWRKSPSEWGK